MATDLVTGVGRLVQGSCFNPNAKKDDNGKDVLDEQGNKILSYYIGVAFRKDDQDFLTRIYPVIVAEAKVGWPEHFNADGSCRLRNFAFKVMDGDAVDDNGKDNKEKPGFAGHWVLKCSSSAKVGAPQVYNMGQLDPMQVVRDPNALKLGYFVRVAISVKGNRPSKSPGVYVNFNVVEIVAHCPPDQVIVTGPDARQILGNAAPITQLPPGAIAIAIGAAPTGVALPGLPGPGVQAVAAIAPRGPASPGQIAPQQSIAPQPMAIQQVAPQIAPAAAQVTYTMTAQANGYTREQYNAQGWSDDQLVKDGLMIVSGGVAPAPQPVAAVAAVAAVAPRPVAPAAIVPNNNFVANAIQAAQPTYVMTAAAQGNTREALHQQGWNDEMLLQQGIMVKQ